MTEADSRGDALPRVSPSGQVDIDWERPLRIAKKGPLYELPKRGPVATGDEWILSVDPVGLRVSPLAGISSAGVSMFLLLFLVLLVVVALLAGMIWQANGKHYAGPSFYGVMGAGILIFLGLASAIAVYLFKFDYTTPLLLNRREQKVFQMQGSSLVESDWNALVPYIEIARTVNYSGGAQFYHLHLIQQGSDQGNVLRQIRVKNAVGGYSQGLAYYEFMRRYMDGNWSSLPDTYLTGGIRQSLLKEFRSNMWNAPFTRIPWDQSSAKRKLVSGVLLVLFTTLWWPVTMLTLVGSRLGHIPKFPREVEQQATYNAAQDGSVPHELHERIKPEEEMTGAEKTLYLVAIAIGAVVWCGPGYGIFSKILGTLPNFAA